MILICASDANASCNLGTSANISATTAERNCGYPANISAMAPER